MTGGALNRRVVADNQGVGGFTHDNRVAGSSIPIHKIAADLDEARAWRNVVGTPLPAPTDAP